MVGFDFIEEFRRPWTVSVTGLCPDRMSGVLGQGTIWKCDSVRALKLLEKSGGSALESLRFRKVTRVTRRAKSLIFKGFWAILGVFSGENRQNQARDDQHHQEIRHRDRAEGGPVVVSAPAMPLVGEFPGSPATIPQGPRR